MTIPCNSIQLDVYTSKRPACTCTFTWNNSNAEICFIEITIKTILRHFLCRSTFQMDFSLFFLFSHLRQKPLLGQLKLCAVDLLRSGKRERTNKRHTKNVHLRISLEFFRLFITFSRACSFIRCSNHIPAFHPYSICRSEVTNWQSSWTCCAEF